jgi:hypothetical protein
MEADQAREVEDWDDDDHIFGDDDPDDPDL